MVPLFRAIAPAKLIGSSVFDAAAIITPSQSVLSTAYPDGGLRAPAADRDRDPRAVLVDRQREMVGDMLVHVHPRRPAERAGEVDTFLVMRLVVQDRGCGTCRHRRSS